MSKTGIRNFAFGLLVATIILSPPAFFPFDFAASEENPSTDETNSADTSSNTNDGDVERANEAALKAEISSLEEELETAKEDQEQLADELEEQETSENNQHSGDGENSDDETVRLYLGVSSGMTAGEIAAILEESEIIDDRSDFTAYIEDHDMMMDVRSGKYELTNELSIPEIAEMITS
ncbi:hypothetical protein [Salisediminibacterium halotolerans]|uniref:YceG-like family protein n=1 Tax=Salisediminibacterium halotolerans TaxID=517425 RepID=A0A1H9WQ91_9BACI|nr:hypothetical protein [Salisediminibacterium haloalkalitolerans]SES35573.1 hypothetical protein SAMN05444126_1414 [Salisediminibacterium haloalkalitolerans]